jgi:hypothetical protein
MASKSTLCCAVLKCLATGTDIRTYIRRVQSNPIQMRSEEDAGILQEETSLKTATSDPIFTTRLAHRDLDDSSSNGSLDSESEENLGPTECLYHAREVQQDQDNNRKDYQNALQAESEVDEDLVNPRRHYARLKALHAEVT